jgi:hypothetical protein
VSIAKGSNWGMSKIFPADSPIAASNASLRRLVLDGATTIGLSGGDLFRTVGGATTGDRLRRNDPDNLPAHLPIDLIEVCLDDTRTERFVTHLIGHDRLWRNIVAAMNADFWRRYQLGPHAHPGDGVIDVYTARLAPADLLKVAPRAKSGTHVPHPAIALQRAAEMEVILPRAVILQADDEPVGKATRLCFRVLADAITVVV